MAHLRNGGVDLHNELRNELRNEVLWCFFVRVRLSHRAPGVPKWRIIVGQNNGCHHLLWTQSDGHYGGPTSQLYLRNDIFA